MEDARLQRASLLFDQGRYEQAEQELAAGLAQDPDDGRALGLLALCRLNRQKLDDAESLARRSIAADPDSAWGYRVLGLVLLERNDLDGALEMAQQTVDRAPWDGQGFVLRSQILCRRKHWQPALEAADAALELDPDDLAARNLRAMALKALGQRSAALDELNDALRVAPENALSHANLAWSYLQRGQLDLADRHFREALRLDPELEWAQHGMLETLKARVPVYRWLLSYFLWMQEKTAGAQWMILLGAYFGFRFLRTQRDHPTLKYLVVPLMAAYIGFCVLTWFSTPISNALLLLHPLGRLALPRPAKRQALAVCGLLAVAIGLAIGAALGQTALIAPAVSLAALAMAVSLVFQFDASQPRRWMWGYIALLALAGIGFTMLNMIERAQLAALPAPLQLLLFPGLLIPFSFLVTPLLANYLGNREWRR